MKISKYLKVGLRLLKANIMTEMMYRTNFFFGSITTIVYFIVQVFYIYFLYQAGGVSELGGFTREEIYFVLICHQLVMAFLFAFILDNFNNIIDQMHQGQLDHFLTKPIQPTFLMLSQKINIFGPLSILFYSGVSLVIIYYRGNVNIDPGAFLIIFLIMVLSLTLMHSLYMISVALCFWFNQFWALFDIVHSFQEIVKYPKAIYPAVMQFTLLFVIPMFNVINPIYGVLRREPSPTIIINLLIVNVIFGTIAWTMWFKGLKRYSSAA